MKKEVQIDFKKEESKRRTVEKQVEKKIMWDLKNAAMLRSKSGGSKQGLAALFSKQSPVAISKDTVLASSTANKMKMKMKVKMKMLMRMRRLNPAIKKQGCESDRMRNAVLPNKNQHASSKRLKRSDPVNKAKLAEKRQAPHNKAKNAERQSKFRKAVSRKHKAGVMPKMCRASRTVATISRQGTWCLAAEQIAIAEGNVAETPSFAVASPAYAAFALRCGSC